MKNIDRVNCDIHGLPYHRAASNPTLMRESLPDDAFALL